MNNLIWFTNNLRITDCESVTKACSGEKVVAVYFFDPKYLEIDVFGFKRTEKFRAKFLIESVTNLQQNLKKHNITLLVYHDSPEQVLPNLIDTYQIDTIFLQKEWTSEETEMLQTVKAAVSAKVNFIESYDQFLFHPKDIPYRSFKSIPDIFTQFRKKCEKYSLVKPIFKAPAVLSVSNNIENDTQIPTLKQLGFEEFYVDPRSAFPFQGGEDKAFERLHYYLWESKKLASYKKTRNGLIGEDYSSKLSAWLANGCISPRTIYWQVSKFEEKVVKNQDTYWLIFELIWRDYFKYISLKYGNKIFLLGGIRDRNYSWRHDESTAKEWLQAATKEPFVNANMLELSTTGWMSNRGRQNVASFWAKELEQDWRIGAAYFESLLIDYDVHSNWGNWMYNSGVGNDPRDRKFNIKRQADTYDRNGDYQNLWLQNTLFQKF